MVAGTKPAQPIYRQLWVHVLIAMAVGVLLGYLNPAAAKAMKPLGDGFIKLIRMIIAPIIFVTVVSGIYKMQSLKEVGRIGIRALVYFEIVSTLALLVGLAVALAFRPGAGVNADPRQLDAQAMAPKVPIAAKVMIKPSMVNSDADTWSMRRTTSRTRSPALSSATPTSIEITMICRI